MYKGASDLSQRRSRRNIAVSHVNENGVDNSVWKDPGDERTQIVARISEIDAELKKLKDHLRNAQMRFATGGPGMPTREFMRLEDNRSSLGIEKLSLQGRLSEMKARQKALRQTEVESFDAAFRKLASEMLAPEVYRRIHIAAAHLFGSNA